MTKGRPTLAIEVDDGGRSLARWVDAPGSDLMLDADTLRVWGSALLETACEMDGRDGQRRSRSLLDIEEMLGHLGQAHEVVVMARSDEERVHGERLIEEARRLILEAVRTLVCPQCGSTGSAPGTQAQGNPNPHASP